jgi:hypothetical protein
MGSAGSFPGFRIQRTRACFQVAEKYCVRKIALHNSNKRKLHLFEDASKAYWEYRLGRLPCLPLDPEWRLEFLWYWFALAQLLAQKNMLASPH